MQPLEGIRVVDLSQHRTGAQATQVLADFGADVVWVEPPGGSTLRRTRAFTFYARGKRRTVLDLGRPDDVQAARDLAAEADVLVECFRPGVADRLGLGYHDLAASNPGLVYASITGFGRHGPYAGVKGYEGLVQAKLGSFHAFRRMAHTDHPPFVTVPFGSFSATQTALHGILTALVERERSGRGQWVEANLVQGFAALDTWEWMLHLIRQRYPDAFTPADPFEGGKPMSPLSLMLLVALTRDGHWLQFAQVAPRLFQALMRALGLDWMLTDPAWTGIPAFDDDERRVRLLAMMHEAAHRKTLAEWNAAFDADPDVFAEVYRSGPSVLEHQQLVDRGQVAVVETELGPVRQPGALVDVVAGEADVGRPAPTADAPDGLPLAGVTVLELAQMYAAPYGATLLSDLGARVVKVEPLTGDPIRMLMPFPECAGVKVMQGKDSIRVDLSGPEGREIVRRIAARATIVLDGFRSGVAERLGLGAGALHAVNPDLVYVSASGYGHGGPDGHRPAYAPSIGAAAGLARANVGDTVAGAPDLTAADILDGHIRLFSASAVTSAQADGFAALGVATAMLLGLLARERGGDGQTISSSMLLTNVHAMAESVVDDGRGLPLPGPGPDLRGPQARYRVYDTADGWVFLAAPSERDWEALVGALRPYVQLDDDDRFASECARQEHDNDLTKVLGAVFADRSADEWERDLLAADVGCVRVTTAPVEQMLQSEEFGRAGGYVVDVCHPTFDDMPRLAPLVRFSRSSTRALPGVLAGNATDAVLRELGYGDDAIAALRERGIVA
ncbi:MAG TPA: CoA transferase [Acidimicrobiia bacterium]|nr:CoA transferase [Acidimicrobiia bacterium]